MNKNVKDIKVKQATAQLYFSRAQSFLLLGRETDFWHDAKFALIFAEQTRRMEMLNAVFVQNMNELEKLQTQNQPKGNDTKMLKQWRKQVGARLDKADEYLSYMGPFDQQVVEKLNRLTACYGKIRTKRQELLLENGHKKKPSNTTPSTTAFKCQDLGVPNGRLEDKLSLSNDLVLKVSTIIQLIFKFKKIVLILTNFPGKSNHQERLNRILRYNDWLFSRKSSSR